jgi:hypothetical protein
LPIPPSTSQNPGSLDDHRKEVLAKFVYKEDMKTKNKKNTNILLYIWLLTQTMYRNLAIVFQILAIENLKNHFILAFKIFTFTFW